MGHDSGLDLGTFGVWTFDFEYQPAARLRESALGVEHAVLFETDPAKARAIAREHLATYLNGQYNVAKFRRLGYTEEDLSNGGSDRFVDDFVFWGDLDSIAGKLHAHVDAGADHVGIQVIGIKPGQTAMPYWRALADALLPGKAGTRPVSLAPGAAART